MSINYFEIDHQKSYGGNGIVYFPCTASSVQAQSRLYFGVKGQLNRYKTGKRVKVRKMNREGYQTGTITDTQNGAPAEIMLDSGDLIPVFGIIIELLPIVEQLIQAIKRIIRNK